MRNPCLEIALRELEAVGIRDVEQVRGGKHWQLRWQVNGRGLRVYSLPGTPSDWRSSHNVRAEVRRMLREDGLLVTTERPEPAPSSATPKIDRVAELERRVAALEELVQRNPMTTARQLFKSACDEARSPSFENPKIRPQFQP